MTGVDEAPKREPAYGAGQGSQRHRAAVGGEALAERQEERNLPNETSFPPAQGAIVSYRLATFQVREKALVNP
jgi:hypothetical protein